MNNIVTEDRTQPVRSGAFAWWHAAPRSAKKALVAASFGWMLDSFDVMLYSMVLASLMADLHLSKGAAGILGSITLLAAAAGGLFFGIIADRFGRTRALMASILIYAIFTAACGLSQNFVQLAVFRILLGLGMGGEWASGASLVSETWPAEHRGKALGLMQSSWAIGYALAAFVAAVVMPIGGWRAVFFVGILPAFLTLWIQRGVEEPEVWKNTRSTAMTAFGGVAEIFRGKLLPLTIALMLMNACCLFAWWGFNLWVPAYLSLPISQGGVGLSSTAMSVGRDRDAGRNVVWLCNLRICKRCDRPQTDLHHLPACCGNAASALRNHTLSALSPDPRPVRRLFRYWLLHRFRSRHR